MGTYGLHDNPDKCQGFAHEKLLASRTGVLPASKWETPGGRMHLCEKCKNKWQRDNWPLKCLPYQPSNVRANLDPTA